MSRAIIDASVTLVWLLEEGGQSPAIEERIESLTLTAPPLWRLELVNAVLVKERRKKITPALGSRFLHILEALDIEISSEPVRRTLDQLALFARPHQLSSYDAAYLELAVTMSAPLWTLDQNLQLAARRIGVELIADDNE